MVFTGSGLMAETSDLGDLMMKKMIGLFLLVILAGCAGNRSDTILPPGNYIQLSPDLSGKMQTFHMKDLSIELSPNYDKTRENIEAKGHITLNHDQIPLSANIFNFSMKVYLLDKDYRILKQIPIWDTSVRSAAQGLPFELSFAYKSEYTFITFEYKFDYHYAFT
jgi:hypothetical protein